MSNDNFSIKQISKRSQSKEVFKRLKKNKIAMVGLGIFAVIIFCTIFAGIIVPYDKAIEQNMDSTYLGVSIEHPFGTDLYGRDIFARVIHGTRTSLLMGIGAVIVGMAVGGLLGSITGYFGGLIDSIITRILDIVMCIPFMLLALALVAAFGSGLGNVLLALMLAMVPQYTRIVRSTILNVVGMDYIEAAKACGTPHHVIILKHVLPNAIGPIIVQATMSVGSLIISAASMSFLGMGIQPPTPEWGAMLSEGKDYMLTSPEMVIFPGMAIVLTSLSVNLLGDGLRDALDPRLKD